MSWEPAPYIPVRELQAAPVTHAWDDEDPYGNIPAVDPIVLARLKEITDLAVIGFAAGCAEWVRVRFGKSFPDPEPDRALEACWVTLARSVAAAILWQPADWSKWLGPVRGPVGIALALMTDSRINADFQGGHYDAARAEALARLVLPPRTSFSAWQDRALTRLKAFYPVELQADGGFGPAVVREALNPAIPLTPENQEVFERTFLSRLNYDTNPFLVRPSEPLK